MITRQQIEAAFASVGGNISETAKSLGVKRTLLYYYVNKTGAQIRKQRSPEELARLRARRMSRKDLRVIDVGKGPVRSDGVSVAIQVAGEWYAWRISRLMQGDYTCTY